MNAFTKIYNSLKRLIDSFDPLPNSYSWARTLLALGLCLTLVFNHSSTLFRMGAGIIDVPLCQGPNKISIFCLLSTNLELARWISIIGLLIIATGLLPRYLCFLHWWLSFSFFSTSLFADGGDQVSIVLTLLLIPICIADSRFTHWSKSKNQNNFTSDVLKLFAFSSLLAIKIQISLLYFHASIGKLQVSEWLNGTAIYYWAIHPIFGLDEPIRSLLIPLLANSIVVSTITWMVIIIEFSLFLGLFVHNSTKKPIFIMGILLHVVIMLMMGLITFSFSMIAALFLYFNPDHLFNNKH